MCNSGLDDYKPSMLGMAAAKLCYDILIQDGVAAMRAAREHLRTPAYENVVGSRHAALRRGLRKHRRVHRPRPAGRLRRAAQALPPRHRRGLLRAGTAHCPERSRFPEIFAFNKAVGLPVCTADLAIPAEQRDELLEKLVDDVYGKRWNVTNVPFYFEKSTLLDAIKYLDAYAAEHA